VPFSVGGGSWLWHDLICESLTADEVVDKLVNGSVMIDRQKWRRIVGGCISD